MDFGGAKINFRGGRYGVERKEKEKKKAPIEWGLD